MESRLALYLSLALASVVLTAGCGRGGLSWDDLDYGPGGFGGSGAGNTGSGAGNTGSGAGNTGSGAGNTGSGAGNTGSGAGNTGSGAGNTGSGASGAGGSTGGGGTGGTEICNSFGDPCTNCAAVNCPEIWCGCAKNQACIDLFGCLGMCQGNETCFQACYSLHEEGVSAVLLVSGCAGTTCESICQWGNTEFTECQECIYSDCSTEMNACMAEKACMQLWQCLNKCPKAGLSCQQGCYNDHGAGVMTLESVLQCTINICSPECD